jgi:hypothetical protein
MDSHAIMDNLLDFLNQAAPVLMVVVSAVVGMLVKLAFDSARSQADKDMAAAKRDERYRQATIRNTQLLIGRAYEDVTLHGRTITHLELELLIGMYSEYTEIGGNGACGFWMEEIRAAHGYGSDAWRAYSRLGAALDGNNRDREETA